MCACASTFYEIRKWNQNMLCHLISIKPQWHWSHAPHYWNVANADGMTLLVLWHDVVDTDAKHSLPITFIVLWIAWANDESDCSGIWFPRHSDLLLFCDFLLIILSIDTSYYRVDICSIYLHSLLCLRVWRRNLYSLYTLSLGISINSRNCHWDQHCIIFFYSKLKKTLEYQKRRLRLCMAKNN